MEALGSLVSHIVVNLIMHDSENHIMPSSIKPTTDLVFLYRFVTFVTNLRDYIPFIL